jgi:GNAT superfamily N-acetyltransferase
MPTAATPRPITTSISRRGEYWDFHAFPALDGDEGVPYDSDDEEGNAPPRPIGTLQVQLHFDRNHATVLAVDVEEEFTRQGIATRLYTELRQVLQEQKVATVGGCLEGSGVVQIREAVFGAGKTQYLLGEECISVEEAIHHMDVQFGRMRVITDISAISAAPYSTSDLYKIGIDLKMCADSWEGDARLLGNIKASELSAMARDYTRLRLQAGITG